jgi:hypothetical protein
MPIRGDRLRWPPRPGKRSNVARSSADSGRGETQTRQTRSTDEQKPAPRQPNERDESADSQASEPRDVIKRAHDDVTGGKVDTDCRNSAVEIVEGNETRRRRTP